MAFSSILIIYSTITLLGLLFLKLKPKGALGFVIMHAISIFIMIQMNIIGEVAYSLGSADVPVTLRAVGLLLEEAIKISVAFIVFLYFVEHSQSGGIRTSLKRFYPYLIFSGIIFALIGNVFSFYGLGSIPISEFAFKTVYVPMVQIIPLMVFSITALYLRNFGIMFGIIAMGTSRIIIDWLLLTDGVYIILIIFTVAIPVLSHISSKLRSSKNIIDMP